MVDFSFSVGSRFLFSYRILVFIYKTLSDFEIVIAIMIAIEKPIRTNRDPVWI
jgi:hypothetical protein